MLYGKFGPETPHNKTKLRSTNVQRKKRKTERVPPKKKKKNRERERENNNNKEYDTRGRVCQLRRQHPS